MTSNNSTSSNDPAGEREKLDEKHVRELELAGGIEGGMEAGSAGGPSQSDAEKASKLSRARGGEAPDR